MQSLGLTLIGVCTGVVYNYTQTGVHKDQSGWEHSVSIPLVRPDMFHLLDQWDNYLDRFSDGPMWDPVWHRYSHSTGPDTHIHQEHCQVVKVNSDIQYCRCHRYWSTNWPLIQYLSLHPVSMRTTTTASVSA